MLAACETGGQLPYEHSVDAVPYETPAPAKNGMTTPVTTAVTTSAAPKAAATSAVVTTYATQDSTLNAPEPSTTPGTDPILVNAVPNAAAKQSAPSKPAAAAGDQFLLAPAVSTSGAAINYQQSDNSSAPISVTFATDDPRRIVVIVRDDLPVKTATLSDPQRRRYLATGLVHKTVAYQPQEAAQSDIGVKVIPNASTLLSGAGIGIPINPSGSTAGGLLDESHFSFMIPDRALYDGSWQKWKIHIDLGDGITNRSMELLPPKPLRG
ncbi:MAG TPA: hypothetical protein VF920_17370 [Dongiaceae bacterium]